MFYGPLLGTIFALVVFTFMLIDKPITVEFFYVGLAVVLINVIEFRHKQKG